MSNNKTAQIVRVPFRDGYILAAEVDGKHWLPLRPLCERFGLAMQPQHRKLQGAEWAVVTEMVMTGSDGKNYQMTCISLGSLGAWLLSIKAGKVKPGVRPALVAYQKEAADVLYRYFFRGTSAAPAATPKKTTATKVKSVSPFAKKLPELLSFLASVSKEGKHVSMSVSRSRLTISFKDAPTEGVSTSTEPSSVVAHKEPPVVEAAPDVTMVPVKEGQMVIPVMEGQTVVSATGSFRVQPTVPKGDFSAASIQATLVASTGKSISSARITAVAYALKILGDTEYGRWSSVYLDTGATRWNWRYNEKGVEAIKQVLAELPNEKDLQDVKAIGNGKASRASLSHEEYLALQHVAN